MSKALRTQDSEQQLLRLQRRHSDLSSRVERLDRRAILTPAEQFEVVQLKRRKLALKDEMEELRRAT
jgi:hypothetical protein